MARPSVKKPLLLTSRCRSDLFLTLARGVSAMPIAQTLDVAKGVCNGALDDTLEALRDDAQKGQSLADAGRRRGLWTATEYLMIHTGEISGRTQAVLERLAQSHEHWARRAKRMQADLMMPALVLVLALFIAPLPALVTGSLTLGGYGLATLGPIVVIGGSVWFGIGSWRSAEHHGEAHLLLAMARRLPLLGPLIKKRERLKLVEGLTLMLEAGMPAMDAVKAMQGTVSDRVLKGHLKGVDRRLRAGKSVSDAFRDAQLLVAAEYAIVATGEAAGRLDESLRRVVLRLAEDVADAQTTFANWAPKMVYGGVLAWMATKIL